MGTAVLRSHDCLKDPTHLDFFGSRPPPPPMKPYRKKPARSPPSSPPSGRSKPPRPARFNPNRPVRKLGFSPGKENDGDPLIRPRSKTLVMGEVTILKRGEDLKPFLPSPPATATAAADLRSDDNDLVMCSTNRLGPDPAILPKFSDLGSVFAGPALMASPSPSSLPLPGFLKKGIPINGFRCLLRLNNLP